ncbi:MAG TPA: TolC family protein [Ignavibacteriaceae bacterium]|nr:TolC family protein [Ignavibacteriaceae bacterium]
MPQNLLDKYVEEGISNNIVLKQKQISLDKALYSLKIAVSYFFPSIDLEGNYTSGEGGRNISFPVGDILNPVYQTLNQLTQSSRFPQLENVKINFYPFHYYDVKLHTTMPIINTDLIINRDIQSDQIRLQEFEVDLYKRELIKEIKTAYYNYLNAISAEKIYRDALVVSEEGKRVNESLVKNGEGLKVYILRSESEIAEINSNIVEAGNNVGKAGRYFNFLLNKNLEDEIDTSYNFSIKISEIDSILSGENDLSNREELKMLETGVSINESLLSMNKLFWIPKVNAFVDLGIQDQLWNYNSDSRYYLFGFQLSVPIFETFRNHYKIDNAELELKNSQLNLDLTRNQIKMSQSIARSDLIAAKQNYSTAIKKLEAARSYEKLIENGYKEGTNSFIETVDARTQLTQASIMLNINTTKVLAALANYERETAGQKIPY